MLEQQGAVLSIRQGGVEWEAQLTAAHHHLSHIETRIHATKTPMLWCRWFKAEGDFHRTLVSACGSTTLKETHQMIYARFRQQLMVEDLSFEFISANIQHHYQILTAALAGDERATRQEIHNHLARHMKAEDPVSLAG